MIKVIYKLEKDGKPQTKIFKDIILLDGSKVGSKERYFEWETEMKYSIINGDYEVIEITEE